MYELFNWDIANVLSSPLSQDHYFTIPLNQTAYFFIRPAYCIFVKISK